jgi:hypothetical protein
VGTGGFSVIVIKVAKGELVGNDTAGGRYKGTLADSANGEIDATVEATYPPGVFGIWGGSVGETVQHRTITATVPKSFFADGTPYTLPSYELKMFAVPVSPDVGYLAERQGLQTFISLLIGTQQGWDEFDARQ